MINNYKTIKQKASIKLSLIVFAMLMLFSAVELKAQLSGTKNIPGDYADLASAIADLNTVGVGPGGVTLNLLAATPQTAPAGGYAITTLTSTSSDPIVITGNGNTITASNTLVGGALNDAIFKVVGSDFVTIEGFTLVENVANTTTAAGTNNMTEWGIALLYASATNGSQNCIIQNNTITLNRTYQNTFGIYVNATHTAAAPTTSATATGAAGGNSGLKIISNTVSNVNNGIVVVGPTASADHNTSLTISGNTVSDYGTTGTFSGFANVSGTVYGVLVRNTNNFNVVNNTITSSNGGVIAGTLRGVFVQAFSNASTGTNTNDVSGNIISLRPGAVGIGVAGIEVAGATGNATTALTINDNDFNNFGHTVAGATGSFTFINAVSTSGTVLVQNNTFSNINVNTTGSVTFVNHNYTMPAAATQTFNNNRIVGSFAKTGAGGTITGFTSNGSSPNGSACSITNNNLSGISVTGATAITGINNTDGAGTSANKIFTGNTFNNWSGGTSAIIGINSTYTAPTSIISNNTISNLATSGSITAITIGNAFAAGNPLTIASNIISGLTSSANTVTGITSSSASTLVNVNSNIISGLSASFAGNTVGINITGGTTTTIYKNKIYDIQNSNASGVVMGIAIGGGTTNNVYNNIIGDLRTTTANAANPLIGINISGGTTANVYYNTVMLNGTSSGALFGASAISASTTPALTLRNNIFINKSTANGAGIVAAYRRSTTTLTSYNAASNNNLFYAGAPSANNVIFYDGTNSDQILGTFKTRVTPSDALSVTEDVAFMSTTGSNANFLHIANGTSTLAESGAIDIATYADDFDGNVRYNNVGYAGTSTTGTDIGADEFDGIVIPQCSGTPTAGTISGVAAVCSGLGTNLTLSGATSDLGITYQWASSTTPGGPYTTLLGTNSAQATGALTVPTYYVVTLTCSNGGATATTIEKSVLINALPVVSTNPTSGNFCTPSGTAVAITGSGASTYTWLPASGLSATTGTTVNASPSATTTYTVTGTDVNGCIGTATSLINVGLSPTMGAVTATPSSVCSGASSQLNATASTAGYTVQSVAYAAEIPSGATTTIFATGDDAVSASIAIPFTFNFFGVPQTTLFAYTNGYVTLGGAAGATTDYGATMPTAAVPNNVIAGVWDDLNVTGAGASVRYFTNGTAPNRIFVVEYTSVKFYNTNANNGNVTFQIKLYEGSNNIEIHSSGVTDPAFSNHFTGIENATGTLAYSPAGRNPHAADITVSEAWQFSPETFTYSWLPATYLNNVAIANPLASGILASTTYTATATTTLGCTATGTVAITAGAALSATTSVAPNTVVCAGTNVTLSGNAVGGGGPFTYAWAGPNAFASTDQNPVLNAVGVSQTGTYTLTITDNCGANAVSQVSFTVNPLPAVAVTPNNGSICLPGGSAVALTASGAPTLTWLPTAGLSVATGTNVDANPTVTTTYTVTGVDGNGCSNTATANIIVSTNPTLTATATPSTICTGGNSQLLATASLPVTYAISNPAFSVEPTPTTDGPSGDDAVSAALPIGFSFNYYGVTYTQFGISTNGNIQLGDGTGTANNPAYSTQYIDAAIPNVGIPNNFVAIAWDDWAPVLGDIKYGTTGTAPNRKLVVSFNTTGRGGGGADTINGQIVLEETSNTIAINVIKKGIQATNTSTQGIENLTGSATSAGVMGRQNTAWSVNNQTTLFTPFSPVFNYSWLPATYLDNATIANPLASAVTASTVYTVTATEATTGCSSTQTVNVDLTPFSAVNVTPAPSATVCAGVSVTLTAVPVGGGMPHTYLWSPGGQTTDAITFNAASTQTYTVDVTDNCGTLVTQTVTLNVNQLPVVTATPTTATYCNPGTAVAIAATGADTYAWLPVTSLDVANAANVNSSPVSTITYTVTGTDALTSCTNTATVTITSAATPTLTTSATPSTPVCAGDTVQLNSSAVIPVTYVQSTSVYAPEVCGVTAGPNGDDVVSAALPIGFSFNYYGVPYTQFAISTNGNIQLGDGSGATNNPAYSTAYADAAIPNAAVPNNIVALAWDDWLVAAGEITYGVNGVAPNRKLVVCFNTTGRGGGAADTLNGQIVLEETTNNVVLNMFNKGVSINTATQGIENATGGITSSPVAGRNNQAWSLDSETRIFTPYSGTYTYNWSPATSLNSTTISNPSADAIQTSTVYSLTVTEASGCTASSTVSITVNQLPVVSLGADVTVCADAIPLTLDAANVGSTFVWSTSEATQTIDVSANGTYDVSVTDVNGCVGKDTIVVTVAAPVVVNLGSDAPVCLTTSNVLDAANVGSTYLWNDNSTNQTLPVTGPGTFMVEVTSPDGCVGKDTVVFSDNSPIVTLSLPFSTTCVDAAVNALSGESPVGGTFSGTGVTGSNFDATVAGAGSITIDYTYTDGTSGCSATASSVVVVDPCIGLNQLTSSVEYSVYPNPTNGQFEISVPSKEVKLKAMLYSAEGKLVYSSELSGRDSYNVNISEFANAVYFLKIYVDGGVKIIKVVKQF